MANIALKTFKTDELVKELTDRMVHGIIMGLSIPTAESDPTEIFGCAGSSRDLLGDIEMVRLMVVQDFEMRRAQVLLAKAQRSISVPDLKVVH